MLRSQKATYQRKASSSIDHSRVVLHVIVEVMEEVEEGEE
jgi:hypothetical protein